MIGRDRLKWLLGLWLLPPFAAACDDESLPVRYISTIQQMNWDAQASFLAADARYYDPTMQYFDREAIDLAGPEAIVDFWRSSSEVSGTQSIRYEVTSCFETADITVFHYDISVDVSGAFWNVNKEEITMPGKLVTVVHTADGKVIEHIDYVDYAGSERYVDTLREQYGPAENKNAE